MTFFLRTLQPKKEREGAVDSKDGAVIDLNFTTAVVRLGPRAIESTWGRESPRFSDFFIIKETASELAPSSPGSLDPKNGPLDLQTAISREITRFSCGGFPLKGPGFEENTLEETRSFKSRRLD